MYIIYIIKLFCKKEFYLTSECKNNSNIVVKLSCLTYL